MNLLESLYYWGYSLKKRRVLAEQKRLPYPVVSIGNITVGGTGKTPATIAVAEEAKKRGFYPVILTRGYRGKAKGPCRVQKSEARSQKSDETELFGDEPVLMAERLRDVPVIKAPDRYEGGLFAIELLRHSLPTSLPRPGGPSLASTLHDSGIPFLFILDDGFQHWRIFRNLDIVLVDGINPFGNRRLLPMGPLRAPLVELREADFFVITKQRNEGLRADLTVLNPHAPIFFAEYRVGALVDGSGNAIPLESLKQKRVYAFCGIGTPESFRNTLSSLIGELGGFRAFRDHHLYTEKDLIRLRQEAQMLGCDAIMTTEKDMVKIRGAEAAADMVYPRIDFSADAGFFDELFQGI
ncbi:MAG: tetraacyldisaccharide 4'-kinase [Nitrospirales bacterium]|nr:tetraacyldisaccharide 4'-kinase [Nitrospirales bacterium]